MASREALIRELREGRQALQLEFDNHLVAAVMEIHRANQALPMFKFARSMVPQKIGARLEGMEKELSVLRMYLKMLMDSMAERQAQLEAEEEAENGSDSGAVRDSADGALPVRTVKTTGRPIGPSAPQVDPGSSDGRPTEALDW